MNEFEITDNDDWLGWRTDLFKRPINQVNSHFWNFHYSKSFQVPLTDFFGSVIRVQETKSSYPLEGNSTYLDAHPVESTKTSEKSKVHFLFS